MVIEGERGGMTRWGCKLKGNFEIKEVYIYIYTIKVMRERVDRRGKVRMVMVSGHVV